MVRLSYARFTICHLAGGKPVLRASCWTKRHLTDLLSFRNRHLVGLQFCHGGVIDGHGLSAFVPMHWTSSPTCLIATHLSLAWFWCMRCTILFMTKLQPAFAGVRFPRYVHVSFSVKECATRSVSHSRVGVSNGSSLTLTILLLKFHNKGVVEAAWSRPVETKSIRRLLDSLYPMREHNRVLALIFHPRFLCGLRSFAEYQPRSNSSPRT